MAERTPTIRKLSEAVVNRIAAGEIIQRPANAIKELIENSLDAGSTSITITVKDGGLKVLQIQDNGHGISKEDLPLVCERFATSKIREFEDLSNIGTYGFRGEALASISHVSHVAITTKTADSACAWKAHYSDGVMVPAKAGGSSDAKPTAGNVGTQILIEDLFFNVPIRKKALKAAAEEYNRIVDVVTRYAIHNSSVSFTCKKVGSNSADFRSTQGSTRDVIRQVYGPAVAKELIDITHHNDELEFKINAVVSNANYNMKKMVFLLFINHRAVDSSNIKRAMENLYSVYLPKNAHAFCYISLEMKPQNVDVNVHPTKKEVMFLNEEKVIEALCDTIKDKLANVNDSRMFKPAQIVTTTAKLSQITNTADSSSTKSKPIISTPTYRKEHEMVRTDSRLQTLDSFIKSNPTFNKSKSASPAHLASSSSTPSNPVIQRESSNPVTTTETPKTASVERMEVDSVSDQPSITRDNIVDVQLSSILNLKEKVNTAAHSGMTDLFRNHTLVGPVDDRWMLLQYQTKLFIVDVEDVSRELFYQLALYGFSNFGYLHLSTPVSIHELLLVALNEESALHPKESEGLQDFESIASQIVQTFIQRREMLQEYFSMVVLEDGTLMSLPVILKGYEPNLGKLPLFLIRLGTEVDWQTEEGCFDTFCREIGIFYACEPPYLDTESNNQDNIGTGKEEPVELVEYKWAIEHVVFKALKQWYLPSKEIAQKETVVQVVDLPDLYKVFERC
ncbi:DNA mismatch repair protein MutL [Rhizoclosmatium globosum]|uniref:DNA mismatch repair protein MutL n=1 Tax=Rhizoclosmatium globosum TaxID=329046 RepID=A0A1Y2CMW5_9FUNG|nr:DNA mismatch repair protein MutL [Rhizoclosmatium globosum]|eukprot:ORY48174.1 DNA mismatch repair protein MutL [Rhizoclosmatium globosum]